VVKVLHLGIETAQRRACEWEELAKDAAEDGQTLRRRYFDAFGHVLKL
jgi:hypothetical protein